MVTGIIAGRLLVRPLVKKTSKPLAHELLDLGKGSAGVDGAEADLLNGVSHAVADVVRSM
jgi:hypothetical protein